MTEDIATVSAAATRYAGRTCVYRAYRDDGQLLYVGVAADWAKRWVGHEFERPTMFEQASRLEVTWYDTRAEALAIEADLIRRLRPPFNAVPRERAERPKYGYARFFDPEPLPPAPADISREGSITITAAAERLGIEKKTVRNMLSEFKGEFPTVYGRAPRGHKIRLLSEADVHQLRSILNRFDVADGFRCQENS